MTQSIKNREVSLNKDRYPSQAVPSPFLLLYVRLDA